MNMKAILSIICFALSSFSIKAKTLKFPVSFEEFRLDSSYSWQWDADVKQWKLNGKIIFALDGNGNIVSHVSLNWNGVLWENQTRYFFEYDLQNNVIHSMWQNWNSTSWINLYRTDYSYDVNNYIKNEITEKWNGIGWENSSKTDFVYENNQYLKTRVTSSWSNGTWISITRQINSYDANYDNISSLNQHWDSDWKNQDQYQFTYDSNHDVMTELSMRWVNETWVDFYRSEWIWNSNRKPLLIQRERFDGTEWNLTTNDIYTYNLPEKYTHLSQWFTNNQWVNDNQELFEYNSNQNLLSEVIQDWDEDQWLNEDSIHVYYSNSTAIKELTVKFPGIEIYPNPAISTISINLESLDNTDHPVFQIFSNSGMKLTGSGTLTQQIKTIDVSWLPAGSYVVLINSRKGPIARNFIKL